jgi:hypothetical protein
VYAVGFLLHTADHLRRGLEVLTPEVLWAGSISGVMAVAAIALALVGHPLAPLIAVAHGFSQALGVSAVHLLPRWSAFSDSLPDGGVDTLSWAAVLIEIAAAFAFGAACAYVLRRGARRAGVRGVTWWSALHSRSDTVHSTKARPQPGGQAARSPRGRLPFR